MGNLIVHTPKGKSKRRGYITRENVAANVWNDPNGNRIDSEYLLISQLLPPSIKEFMHQLEQEVAQLCGQRYSREANCSRWGKQKGSIYIGGHKVGVERPRVRSAAGKEQALGLYDKFQSPDLFDRDVFTAGLQHVSQRDYSKGIKAIEGSFGFKKSRVSKSWVKSTKGKLVEMMERDIRQLDIISVFIDGKRFRDCGVIVALGVSAAGRKHVLGIFQSDTENSTACLELLNDLERRGLPSHGLLFVVDGGSGINKALESKYAVHDDKSRSAVRLRCHYHKMKNIEDTLGKDHEKMPEVRSLFDAMRKAADSIEARAYAQSLEGVLLKANQSAHRSFLEAKPDLLAIHELGLGPDLQRFFSTTNPIENINYLTEEDMRRVKRWRDSEHFQRWYATSAMNAERRMHKVKGHRGLQPLKEKLLLLTTHKNLDEKRSVA